LTRDDLVGDILVKNALMGIETSRARLNSSGKMNFTGFLA